MTQDAQLLEALRAGDDRARDQLYRTHAEQVLTWAIRLAGPGMDPEDLAHEVFIVALKGIHRFRGECSLSTWLFGITRRVLANARRRQALRRFVGLDRVVEPTAEGHSPERRLQAQQERDGVRQALQALSIKHREVIVLVELEQRSTADAAAMLGVPTGTVHSRLHAARRALASRLRRMGWEEQDGQLERRVVPLGRST